MIINTNVGLGNIHYVVGNDEQIVSYKRTKSLVIVGIVAVMRSICGKNAVKAIEITYLPLLLRSKAPSRRIFEGMLVIKGEAGMVLGRLRAYAPRTLCR